jgi:hypothetical protein
MEQMFKFKPMQISIGNATEMLLKIPENPSMLNICCDIVFNYNKLPMLLPVSLT